MGKRCGCVGKECNCSIKADRGISFSGVGNKANPLIVSTSSESHAYMTSRGVVSSATPTGGAADYTSEVLADSPLLWWRMDEASGTTAVDSSSNSRSSANYQGGPTLGATGLITTGSAVSFSGGAFAYIGYSSWMDTNSASVEVWFKANAISGLLAAHDDNGTNLTTRLDFNGTKIRFLYHPQGQAYGSIESTTSPTTGTTYHVVATYDGSFARLYINGTLESSAAVTVPLHQPGNAPMVAGASSYAGQQPFNGVEDEVAFYGSALSQARVSAHYAAGLSSGGTPVTPTDSYDSVSITGTGSGVDPIVIAMTLGTVAPVLNVALYSNPGVFTWTKPPGGTLVLVIAVGGGMAGSAGAKSGVTTSSAASGGVGGGYTREFVLLGSTDTSAVVRVGAGGLGTKSSQVGAMGQGSDVRWNRTEVPSVYALGGRVTSYSEDLSGTISGQIPSNGALPPVLNAGAGAGGKGAILNGYAIVAPDLPGGRHPAASAPIFSGGNGGDGGAPGASGISGGTGRAGQWPGGGGGGGGGAYKGGLYSRSDPGNGGNGADGAVWIITL